MEKFYRGLLKRSFGITWKYKWLWIFGFFATLLGNGTLYENVVRTFTNMSDGRSIFFTLQEYANTGLFSKISWTKILDLAQTDTSAFTISLFSLLVLAALFAIALILAIVSQSGLVKASVAIDQKKKISLKQAFQVGLHKFWPVLGMNVVMRVVLFGLVLLLALLISLILVDASLLNAIVYVIGSMIILILSIIVYFLTIYASAFIVLRDKSVFSSIRYAWYLFKNNVLLNLEMGFLLFIVQIIVGILAVVFALFVISPFILIYLLLTLMSVNAGVNLLGMVIVFLIALIVIITGSWFTAFQISTWSLMFEELALKKGQSKIVRVIHGLTGGGKKSTKKRTTAKKKPKAKSKK